MNSYERVFARVAGKEVDRLPNFCILMGFAAKHAGISYTDLCLDPEAMVKANLKYHNDFDIDCVTVMSDPYCEAIDYGMEVRYTGDETPKVLKHLWDENDTPDAADIYIGEVKAGGRMAARIKVIEQLSKELKGKCPVVGWVEGAVAEYCDLRGTSAAMLDFASDEEGLPDILDALTTQAVTYVKAQVEAGADIIGIGDAACSLLGPALYKKYGKPYEKRIIDAIHEAGAIVKLHICGNTAQLLDDINEIKPDIFDCDWLTPFDDAISKLDGIAVSGNFDPVTVMLQGTPESIAETVRICAKNGNSRNIIAAGCEVPPATPKENLLAVATTIKQIAAE